MCLPTPIHVLSVLSWLDVYFIEHILSPQSLGYAFCFVFGQRMIDINAGNFKNALVNHDDAQRAERDTRGYLNVTHVVNLEVAGLFHPILYEGIAQSMLSL